MKNTLHPSGITISFDPSAHRYTDFSGRGPYDSVTSIVKALFAPFDESGTIAAHVAARDGTTADAVRASWEASGAAACTFGTRVHETSEDCLLDRPPRHQPATDRERAAMAAAWDACAQIRATARTVHPEVILADPESLTAGTADLIAIRRSDSRIVILDWKTSARIDAASRFGNARALPPYAHLPDCNLVHYALQLAIYAWIIRNAGYMHALQPAETATGPASQQPVVVAVELVIAHIAPDKSDVDWIAPPDLSSEADDIMRRRRADAQRWLGTLKRCSDADAADAEADRLAAEAQNAPENRF